MKPTGAHRILVECGELLSWLALPDMAKEQAAPAVVRFSADDGVTAWLLDAPDGWPTELGARGELIVHGVAVDGGAAFTILDARVQPASAQEDRALPTCDDPRARRACRPHDHMVFSVLQHRPSP